MQTLLSLSDLKPGQSAKIERFLDVAMGVLRLQEMGLLPGTLVEVLRKAPWGGPIQIKVRGSLLSLRRSEAALLSVLPA